MKFLSVFLILVSSHLFATEIQCEKIIKGSENNDSEYQLLLKRALEYRENYFSKEKDLAAFCILNQLASKGYADAEAALATFYEYGEIVVQDPKTAFEMTLKAAEKGSGIGLNNLGSYYFYGKYVPQNLDKAISYYQQAVDKGEPYAKISLSYAYFTGQGVSQNTMRAIELALDVVQNPNSIGYETAANNLGFYYGSIGLKEKQLFWLEKAAEKYEPLAQVNLGVIYATDANFADLEKSLYWFDKSMERGNPEAYFKLANLYETGSKVIKKDQEKSFGLYRKAADLNHGMAQYNLGVKLFNGLGVKKDEKASLVWYLKAANENNILNSMISLHKIYNQGTQDIPQDLEKSKYWLNKARENGFSQ